MIFNSLFTNSTWKMCSVIATVLVTSALFPFNGALGGSNIQEWIFMANNEIDVLAVTDLKRQRVVSTLECDVKCSQYPHCTITVYDRSTSLCAMFRIFDKTQDRTPTILHGNFNVRHFMVIDDTPVKPSCPFEPPPLRYANVSDGNQLVGTVRTYTCLHGNPNLSTNEMTANTTCLGNLTWAQAALQCPAIICPGQPPPLTNAKLSDGSHLVGSIRRYTCHQGYRDKSTKAMTAKTTCLSNLTWSRVALKCSAHSCQNEPPPIAKAVVSGKGVGVGRVWTYTCHNGYMDSETNMANTTCLENLTWSHTTLQCSGPWLKIMSPANCIDRELTWTEMEKVFINGTLIFLIQTCHSAYASFKEYKNNKMIETGICIGCGENTFWEIKGCSVKNEKNVVSCTEFRPFWIRFHVDTVAVGKGLKVGEREVMFCKVSGISPISLVLATCVGYDGYWQFLEQ